MNEHDHQQDHLIRLLAPTSHLSPSAQSPYGDAANELLENILRNTEAPAREPVKHQSWLARRRWPVVAVPTVAVAAALAFAVGALLPNGSGPVGPAPAQALQITEDDGYIIIKINDPVADPQRYREELARHHLDIELILAPVEADQVGKVIFAEISETSGGASLEWIEAPGDCTANGNCSAGIKVPVTFTSYAKIVIGRTAQPGEEIEDGGSPDGASAADRVLIGKSVAQAREILASRGRTATYRVGNGSFTAVADDVPATWIVYDVATLSGNVVALWVSADGVAPKGSNPSMNPTVTPSPAR
jgi:hypothetical protein